jgi:hypothetical protein
MNSWFWFVQVLLAGIFLFDGFRKIFGLDRRKNAEPSQRESDRLPYGFVVGFGLMEIVGALGLLMPGDLWPPNILLRVAAGGLALLMLAVSIYRGLRRELPAPAMTLCFVALYVLVGRWP